MNSFASRSSVFFQEMPTLITLLNWRSGSTRVIPLRAARYCSQRNRTGQSTGSENKKNIFKRWTRGNSSPSCSARQTFQGTKENISSGPTTLGGPLNQHSPNGQKPSRSAKGPQTSDNSRRLDELMSVLQHGDILVVSELSRLGRSLGQIVAILDALAKAVPSSEHLIAGWSPNSSKQPL